MRPWRSSCISRFVSINMDSRVHAIFHRRDTGAVCVLVRCGALWYDFVTEMVLLSSGRYHLRRGRRRRVGGRLAVRDPAPAPRSLRSSSTGRVGDRRRRHGAARGKAARGVSTVGPAGADVPGMRISGPWGVSSGGVAATCPWCSCELKDGCALCLGQDLLTACHAFFVELFV